MLWAGDKMTTMKFIEFINSIEYDKGHKDNTPIPHKIMGVIYNVL
jgi:hypothetical protein